jgi:16S rRNA (cytosine967-C5)-methyltransferase
MLRASNEPAERALRVNTLRDGREQMRRRLGEAGVAVTPAPGPAPLDAAELLVLDGRLGEAAGLVESGDLVPQSRGSAAVVELLDPRPGQQVLDLCAGPGIKTGQIAARMEDRGELIAVDSDPERAAQVAEQAERLGLRSVTVIEADAAGFELGDGFDRVLVDAPCSGLGTLASRPDVRWRRSPQAIERLAELQGRILARAARLVRPGGSLVYATCTLSRAENEDVVAGLLAGEAGPAAIAADDLGAASPQLASPVDPRFLRIRPDRDRTTGFFVARLSRHD